LQHQVKINLRIQQNNAGSFGENMTSPNNPTKRLLTDMRFL